MNRTRSNRLVAVAAGTVVLVVAAIMLFAGSGLLAAGPVADPSGSPKPSTSPKPSGPPNPGPTDEPAPTLEPPVAPEDDASDGVVSVPLANWPGVDSWVLVWDESDSLADAESGSPDRQPVPANVVETAGSADGSIVRLTWSDLPVDSKARLSIRRDADGTYKIRLVRLRPAGPSDNVASERVVELHFHASVPVDDVEVELVESLVPTDAIGLVQSGITGSDGTGLTIAVWDETEGLTGAGIDRVEGNPAVGPETVLVVNDDADRLRVTWADPEAATYAKLSIRMADNGRYQLRIVRERPQGPTAPAALERVVLLDFGVSVPADDVDVEVIDGIANGA
jgi:hypothetical protein